MTPGPIEPHRLWYYCIVEDRASPEAVPDHVTAGASAGRLSTKTFATW